MRSFCVNYIRNFLYVLDYDLSYKSIGKRYSAIHILDHISTRRPDWSHKLNPTNWILYNPTYNVLGIIFSTGDYYDDIMIWFRDGSCGSVDKYRMIIHGVSLGRFICNFRKWKYETNRKKRMFDELVCLTKIEILLCLNICDWLRNINTNLRIWAQIFIFFYFLLLYELTQKWNYINLFLN